MNHILDNAASDIFPVVEPVQKEKIIDWYAEVTQFLAWPVVFLIFIPFFKLQVNDRENLKKIKAPFIIISNHFSFYDSFLFRLILGLNTPHLPLRFMAVKKFNWRFLNILSFLKIIDLVYILFGVFIITPGKGIKENLKKAKSIIESGANVVIYPEGKIVEDEDISPFKKGAAVLSRQMNVPILPISFREDDKNKFRRKIVVNVGQPISLDADSSDDVNTETLRETILSLYNRL